MKRQKVILAIIMMAVLLHFSSVSSVVSAKSIKLNKRTATLQIGQTIKLKVLNSKKRVKWSSSKKKIVTVTAKGKVKARKKGNAKIYAKVAGKKLVCKVKVKAAEKKDSVSEQQDTKEKSDENQTLSYTFRYPSYLTQHYEKHGQEVGASSEEEYLAKANAVINNPSALHKLEAEDKDHVYFVEATNEIVFLSQDGFIRTYFICSGIDYFNRQ